jgi:Tfp pilus assembly protein FimT
MGLAPVHRIIGRERGMTTLELAITLAITGAISVFFGTELEATANRVYLETAVAEVLGDLRYARSLAARDGQTVHVAVDHERPEVTILRAGKPEAPPRNLEARGVRLIHSSGGNLIAFSPRGTSATPTTLTLEDRRGSQRVVTVSLTGLARVR